MLSTFSACAKCKVYILHKKRINLFQTFVRFFIKGINFMRLFAHSSGVCEKYKFYPRAMGNFRLKRYHSSGIVFHGLAIVPKISKIVKFPIPCFYCTFVMLQNTLTSGRLFLATYFWPNFKSLKRNLRPRSFFSNFPAQNVLKWCRFLNLEWFLLFFKQ